MWSLLGESAREAGGGARSGGGPARGPAAGGDGGVPPATFAPRPPEEAARGGDSGGRDPGDLEAEAPSMRARRPRREDEAGAPATKRGKFDDDESDVKEERAVKFEDEEADVAEEERQREKDAISRDRNREYARNTRLRKKAYVKQLEQAVQDMRGEKRQAEADDLDARERERATRRERLRILRTALYYRGLGEVSEDKWHELLDDERFVMTLPVTPYRPFDPRSVVAEDLTLATARTASSPTAVPGRVSQTPGAPNPPPGHRRVLRGVRGMVFDTASLAVLLQSVGIRGRRGHTLLRCRYETSADEDEALGPGGGHRHPGPLGFMLHEARGCMGLFSMKTTNAVQCGARCECGKYGMLKASFHEATHKLTSLELTFDVLAFMRQLQSARDSGDLEIVPNTLRAAERMLDDDDAAAAKDAARRASSSHAQHQTDDEAPLRSLTRRPRLRAARPRLITVATRPHVITTVNAAFSSLCGFSRAEAVGRTLRLIQGPATDGAVVDDLLRDVQLRLPSSMIVVNYHRDGTKFINYLRVFPLYRDGDAPDDYSHYLGELERLDDDVVAHIERTFHWELAATATTPQPPPQRPPGGQPA